MRFINGLTALMALAHLALPTTADQFYRWTDAEGRVHFSDRPPTAAPDTTVEKRTLPRFAEPATSPGEYSVLQQWQRLSEERRAQAQARREREDRAREYSLRQREVAAAERAAEQAAAQPAYTGPVWLAPPRFRPGHRPGRWPTQLPATGLWKRDHPAYRPRGPGNRPHPRNPGVRLQR